MIDSGDSSMVEPSGPIIENWDLSSGVNRSPSYDPDEREPVRGQRVGSFASGPCFALGSARDEAAAFYAAAVTRTVSPPWSTEPKKVVYPSKGDLLGGFRIVHELGRGAFARVYLAEQTELAGRPVAIKVAEALGDEPQALARLQHTHIVPIHSIHDDPATGLRLLCMPYFGGANLAQVLERSGAKGPSLAGGGSLIEALDSVGGRPPTNASTSRRSCASTGSQASPYDAASRGVGSPSMVRSILGRYWARLPWWGHLEGQNGSGATDPAEREADQPARKYLRSHTYVQAAAWIAARLAEGLEHAHARGILHRDLKPSNILIAADGTPMLLDFNLAIDADPDRAGDAGNRAMLGGTLPYMSPEHLDAFHPRGKTRPEEVDERSDIYALGLILFEMLAGHHAFEETPEGLTMIDVVARMAEQRREGAPSVRKSNPMVPPSLDAIVAKCLEVDPDRRYARAGDLAEDLNRHLEDRPNKFAPDPSPRERAGKWWRRHPQVRGAGPVAAMAASVIFVIVATAWSVYEYAEGAHARLLRNEFREQFTQCQLLLNTTSGPSSHRGRGLEIADRVLKAYRVNDPEDWTQTAPVRRLASSERNALREEVSELILLSVRARVAGVAREPSEIVRRKVLEEAVAKLKRAESIDPSPSAALYEDRARYLSAMGRSEEAQNDRAKAEKRRPRTARDFYLRGTARAARGWTDLAEADLGRAVALDPKRFWAWFVLGLCHFDQHRFADAVGDFNVCTLIAPEFAWPHLNRGLALAAEGRLVEAHAAYDRALSLNRDFVEALVDRALVCLELDIPATAERDLNRAISLGRRDPAILAARAEALSRLGQADRAEAEFAEVLRARPNDPRILVARGFSRIATKPREAEADFRKVLERDGRHARALLGLSRLLAKDPATALPLLNTALEVEPNLNEARQFRALLRARTGDHGAVADVDRLILSPSQHNLYNAACALAILSEKTRDEALAGRAVDVLRRSFDVGFPRSHADEDTDLATLRGRRDFAKLMASKP